MRVSLSVLSLILLAACQREAPPPAPSASATASVAAAPSADPLTSRDNASDAALPDSEARPTMQAQVVLDRLGFTPGVVDGKEGLSTRNAVSGFQEANGLAVTGKLDPATKEAMAQWQAIAATRVVTIPEDFAAGPFAPVPKEPADQAKLTALGYATLEEKLAERFHTTVETLKLLNPGGLPAAPQSAATTAAATTTPAPESAATPATLFRAGQQIRVPNVGGDRIDPAAVKDADWLATLELLGVGTDQPKVDRVVVSKSKGTLKAYDQANKLVAVYTATMGSQYDPLPLGTWKVNGVDRNPKFHYNPKLFWDASPGDKAATLPAGPNGPVGVVWIDLNKPHYGIHGTPSPESIGRAQSHGCVRLTNWDAARLAQMVHPGTVAVFEA